MSLSYSEYSLTSPNLTKTKHLSLVRVCEWVRTLLYETLCNQKKNAEMKRMVMLTYLLWLGAYLPWWHLFGDEESWVALSGAWESKPLHTTVTIYFKSISAWLWSFTSANILFIVLSIEIKWPCCCVWDKSIQQHSEIHHCWHRKFCWVWMTKDVR